MKSSCCTVLLTAISLAVTASAAHAAIEFVTVGNAGNSADSTGYGSVNYNYSIGKYEVTAGQYTSFLNAVAATDAYGLYNSAMANMTLGSGITRFGSAGSYTYNVDSAFVDRPVNFVSWGDAARYCNWLHNGQGIGSTEDGAYYLNGATGLGPLMSVTRKADAIYWIPSENEWYKAAYHKNDGITGNYFDFPTSSDTAPGTDLADVTGNNANYRGASYPIDSPYYTTEVGEFENSDSPYGTFDQGGNVWEWNEAVSGMARDLRGGNWYHESYALNANYRTNYDPLTEASNVGFRLAGRVVPEPTGIAVWLGFCAAGVLWSYRKHKS